MNHILTYWRKLPRLSKFFLLLSVAVFLSPFVQLLNQVPHWIWAVLVGLFVGHQGYRLLSAMQHKYQEVMGNTQSHPSRRPSKNHVEKLESDLYQQLEDSLSALHDIAANVSDVHIGTGSTSRPIIDVISEQSMQPTLNCALILTHDPSVAYVIPHSSDLRGIEDTLSKMTASMKQTPTLKYLKFASDRPKFQKETVSKLGISSTGGQIAVDFPINFISYN